MSVPGYPANKSIFYCNLKRGLLKLQEETAGTSHADIDQDDASLAGVLQGAVGRTVCYCLTTVLSGCCWAIIQGFPSRDAVSNPSASCGRSFCASAIRLLGSMVVTFLRGRLWLVGACAFDIQMAKQTLHRSTNVASHLLSFYQLQKLSSPRMTTWFGSHCLQSGIWASPLLPIGVPTVSGVVLKRAMQSDCLTSDSQLQQLFLLKGLHLQRALASNVSVTDSVSESPISSS